MFRSMTIALMVLAAVQHTTQSARAQFVMDVDGLFEDPGVFNDFPSSNLTITNNYPATAIIDDRDFGGGGAGAFANRHDLLFTATGDSFPREFDPPDSFDISFDLTLEAGSNTPRKEAGLRINNQGFDGLFIVNSDAREIVAFGGPLPFFSFNTAHGLSYMAGETINMRAIYTAPIIDPVPENSIPGTIEYIVDLASDSAGPYTSGKIEFTNNELGIIAGSELGVYAQAAPNNPATDFVTATFENFHFGDGDTGGGELMGDYNGDDVVDAADYAVWRNSLSQTGSGLAADGNNDSVVNELDYTIWKQNYGTSASPGLLTLSSAAVPEPAAGVLALAGLFALLTLRFRGDQTIRPAV